MTEATVERREGRGLEENFIGKNPKGFVAISMRKYKYFINDWMLCKYNFHHLAWKVQRKFEWPEKSGQQMMLDERLEGRCCQNIQMFSHFQAEKQAYGQIFSFRTSLFKKNTHIQKKNKSQYFYLNAIKCYSSACRSLCHFWFPGHVPCVLISVSTI